MAERRGAPRPAVVLDLELSAQARDPSCPLDRMQPRQPGSSLRGDRGRRASHDARRRRDVAGPTRDRAVRHPRARDPPRSAGDPQGLGRRRLLGKRRRRRVVGFAGGRARRHVPEKRRDRPGDPDVVVVSAASHPHSAYMSGRSDGRLYRREGGGRWRRVSAGWPDPPATIAPLLAAGREPGELWAADERGVHRSADGGATWHAVAEFDPTPAWLRGIVILP